MARSGRPPEPPPVRRSQTLLILGLLALGALGIGFAAALLPHGALAPLPSEQPGTFSGEVTISAVGEIFAAVLIGAVLLVLYVKIRAPPSVVPKRFTAVFLVWLLVGIGFIAATHIVFPGTFTVGSSPLGQNNSSGLNQTQTGTNNTNVSLNPGQIGVGLPVGVWIGVGLAVVAIIAGLLVGAWWLGRPAREFETPSEKPPGVDPLLRRSLSALDAGADPRATLIALYAELLRRVSGQLGHLEASTPREIELLCVQELRLAPAPSAELRALFEEARYSTRPMGAPEVARARAALHAALAPSTVGGAS